MSEFPTFRKIPRLHKPIVITEKIDGTNALVSIEREGWGYSEAADDPTVLAVCSDPNVIDPDTGDPAWQYVIRAGSRNRWLTPDSDNFGFASWVNGNLSNLVKLGPGNHYGEWFGKGIQRGYGLDERRFALFNVARWFDPREDDATGYRFTMPNAEPCPDVCTVVPILRHGQGENLSVDVAAALCSLRIVGSSLVDGWDRPEGVVVYHMAAGQYFKVLLENDNIPKSQAA